MKPQGYIKLHRAIEEWEWIDNPTMFYFWCRILLMANWEDKEWHGQIIERGSFVTTLARLSDALNLSVQQVRTCLANMQSNKQITCKSTNKATKITICKYDDYQGLPQAEQQTENTEINKPTTQTKEGSEYSGSYESSYSSQEEKNIYNLSHKARTHVSAHAQAQAPYPPTPFPYPTPFILSSVERNWCMGDPARIVEIKRRHLEENLKTLENEFGMNEAERKKFLDFWCCPSQRNREEIRAEGDSYFDLRYRVAKWMENNRPAEQKQQSRAEQYAQVSRNFSELVNELYNPNDTGAGNRSADSPDEQ